ncbi:helix-turn-helix domain-containing protein [Acinetobacter colistiniresistens]|uniref:helix-turn-helix domain-containing protein n=1 Tax=Acinetobacter colistiniresistens TaxID=280145 RepID=UPI00211CF039|nr:helix-turn-helix transcriptional regulator [Acinetobacter colistiniresistens]UUM28211.1 helix-turn-helix domain-containing protein [Acinetobacter colistiniresistens]
MDSKALIELAMKLLSCTQKELATRLNVSPTQISKWKKGEYISSDMQNNFKKLLNISELSPEFILRAGSLEDAKKWNKLIHFLARVAHDEAETGYNTVPLQDDLGNLSWHTFHILKQLGLASPFYFPVELDIDYENSDEEAYEIFMGNIENHPISHLIWNIFLALNDVYGFYAAYIAEIIDDESLDLFETDAVNIEPCLMELAACKIDISAEIAPNFNEFRYETLENYKKWLNIVKDNAFRANIPLRAELLNLIYDSQEEISYEAEAESLGFNERRIHPDIYMNELLVGMRTLHQVLPVIMKKLEIYDEFKLDPSDLKLGH